MWRSVDREVGAVKQVSKKFQVVPLSEVPRTNVSRENAPRNGAAAEKDFFSQTKKAEPYAVGVRSSQEADVPWRAYCKHCELRFTPKQQPSKFASDNKRAIWLRCPYCGHADEYTVTDLLRAMEDKLGGINTTIQ